MQELTFVEQLQQFVANHTIMVMAWVAILVAVIVSFYKSATSKITVVNNAQATLLMNNEDAVIIDVRSDEEFKAGRIIDSQKSTPSDIKTGKIQQIEKFKDRPVIVVDQNGLTAQGLANTLVKHGFTKVYALKEGILGWRGANLPLVKK